MSLAPPLVRAPSVVALSLALASALALRAEAPPPQDGWERVGETDGVTVFKRDEPHTPFLAIKGSGVVEVPPSVVALVLLDDARAPEWVDALDEARVVNVLSASEYVEYNHVHMPWPVSDREFLTRVSLALDGQAHSVQIRSAPMELPGVPPRKGSVRGVLSAIYTLEPIAGASGKPATRLTVEIHSDPGGWLPGWVVNFFQKDWAHETIAGIRGQCKKPDLTAPTEFASWLGDVARALDR